MCESVLAEDSGGDDCEYLYKCPSRNPKHAEYVSLHDYDMGDWNCFYAGANESSSDDMYNEEENPDRDSDGNSFIDGDSCDDEHELADPLVEDTLLDYELKLRNRDVRFLADTVAPSLIGHAPRPASRKVVRLCLQEERVRAVLMALHPRLGRDSPLRLLDPGIVFHIADMMRTTTAAGTAHLAAFEDFRRKVAEEEAEWADEMFAELEATSDEEGEEGEEGEVLGCLGLPTMSSIVQDAIANAAAGGAGSGATGSVAPASPRREGESAVGAWALRRRLDDEVMEALECAGEGYLRDLEQLAAAVGAPARGAMPRPHVLEDL